MESASVSRKEKRKALKKDKRKQIRKELAEKARAEEEARLNDPQVQREIQLEEEKEKERLERERKEFEERERVFLEELERKKKEEEEEQERMNAAEREAKLQLVGTEEGSNEDDDEWEYVEEGPPEIIWQGNEIIVKKNKVKVKKKDINQDIKKEDPNRPTSNPLPPQHEAYASFKNAPMTSAELLDTVAQQVPNFGTEQDKAHCPFHIKTGACRFGSHCNRVHYYPDKSNTLLIKNMYNGPGLAWEQDEGLEYTEEEVERSYEDFYEDVHTEFLKFGELINFKVCRNGCFHLRGNVYVEYKSLDSAVMAYGSVHGRYFAGKQVKCEFVSLTRWKVAICGEYMKSRLKTCSRGSACNFLHCFSNPGGDYEWADSDKPPPRYWVNKMTALFGYSDQQHSSTIFTSDKHSYHSKRCRSIDNGSSRRSHRDETHARRHEHQKDHNVYEHKSEYNINQMDTDSDRDSYHSKRHRSIEHNGSSSRGRHARKSRRQDDHNVYEEETEYKNKSSHPETDSDDRKRHDDRIRRTPYGTSSDEDHIYTKRKSRHRNNISESSSSNGAAKTEHSEGKLLKTKSSRRDEEFKKVEARSRHRPRPRPSRRSHESEAKNDTSDRWQPHDYDDDDDRRIDDGTGSGGVVEDASKDVEHSDDRKREKRKRI